MPKRTAGSPKTGQQEGCNLHRVAAVVVAGWQERAWRRSRILAAVQNRLSRQTSVVITRLSAAVQQQQQQQRVGVGVGVKLRGCRHQKDWLWMQLP